MKDLQAEIWHFKTEFIKTYSAWQGKEVLVVCIFCIFKEVLTQTITLILIIKILDVLIVCETSHKMLLCIMLSIIHRFYDFQKTKFISITLVHWRQFKTSFPVDTVHMQSIKLSSIEKIKKNNFFAKDNIEICWCWIVWPFEPCNWKFFFSPFE